MKYGNRHRLRPSLLAAVLAAAPPLGAATYTVTNTNDSGAGSLRDAIMQSNASVGVTDTIAFNVTGTGCVGSPAVCTIQPASPLPNITDPVIIDGYTQPGSSPNSLAVGDNAVLLIELDGSQIGVVTYGLLIFTDNTVIQGLVINRFNNPGIGIDTSGGGSTGGHVIRGNFIGTNPAGTAAAPNGGYGIFIRSPNDRVGGPNPSDRNVIVGASGAFGTGIRFEGDVGSPTDGDVVQGNYIGTDVTGTLPLGGADGVYIGPGSGITIGGSGAGEGNLISGNGGYGIDMTSPGCVGTMSGNVIQGNLIGTDAAGTSPLPNAAGGIFLSCTTSDNEIGGTAAGAGNVVAFNGSPSFGIGIGVFLDGTAGTGNAIRHNLIFSNKGLGIGLKVNYALPNDPGDGDTGPNDLQNFPIISSAVPGSGSTHITGVIHSTPSTTYELDFYSNPACIPFPHDYLEGTTFLGSGVTTTNASGTGVIDVTVPVQIGNGEHVTATATDPAGNTSEFSQRLPFMLFPASGPPAGGASLSISGTDFEAGATLTIGGAAATSVVVSDSMNMTARTPALSPGSLNDVTVSNTDGSSGTLLKGYVGDFLDVPGSYPFYSYVTKLVSNAITVGCGGGEYCPTADVTRAQMAVFLLKAKYGLCYAPPPATGTVFLDVPADSFAAAWIEALAALGVTGGCGGGDYCPTGSVTRAQMAVFLLKAFLGTSYAPPGCTGIFGDVACPGPFTDWIEDLYTRSITGGCQASPLLYCPSNPDTRGQMAVFITKTFNLQ